MFLKTYTEDFPSQPKDLSYFLYIPRLVWGGILDVHTHSWWAEIQKYIYISSYHCSENFLLLKVIADTNLVFKTNDYYVITKYCRVVVSPVIVDVVRLNDLSTVLSVIIHIAHTKHKVGNSPRNSRTIYAHLMMACTALNLQWLVFNVEDCISQRTEWKWKALHYTSAPHSRDVKAVSSSISTTPQTCRWELTWLG